MEFYLGGALVISALWVLTILKAVMWGKARAVEKLAAERMDAYEKHMEELEKANRAGAAVKPDDSLSNDPNNRG